MNKKILPPEIVKFIKENGVMTLATSDSEPWVCTLYYGTDENPTLYLVTDPNSVHGKMIEKNPNVAFNIFDFEVVFDFWLQTGNHFVNCPQRKTVIRHFQ